MSGSLIEPNERSHMIAPAFNDRIEKKYQIGVNESDIAELWREMGGILHPYGILPVQEITSVGSVYFDNKDFDLLRFSLLGHLMLFRTRAYETFGQSPEAISEYWVEVKTARGARRMKKRFSLTKCEMLRFLEAGTFSNNLVGFTQSKRGARSDLDLYREAKETLETMGLKPVLLVTCKRLAFQGPTDRLSVDWDVTYYSTTPNVYEQPSWKYLVQSPVGKADKVILETKLIGDNVEPLWLAELQGRIPIRAREFLKPVEGMGYLLDGPLKHHSEASFFSQRIAEYLAGSLLG